MNDHGVRIDLPFIRRILGYSEAYTNRLLEEAREITGLPNPNSLAQLKRWLQEHFGLRVDKLTKDTIPELLEELKQKPGAEKGIRMLKLRQELGKTSIKKYEAMENAVCKDGRPRASAILWGKPDRTLGREDRAGA